MPTSAPERNGRLPRPPHPRIEIAKLPKKQRSMPRATIFIFTEWLQISFPAVRHLARSSLARLWGMKTRAAGSPIPPFRSRAASPCLCRSSNLPPIFLYHVERRKGNSKAEPPRKQGGGEGQGSLPPRTSLGALGSLRGEAIVKTIAYFCNCNHYLLFFLYLCGLESCA